MPTYRLELEYEGTRYRGWQEQQNARSVAGELKRAIAAAGGEVVELGGAGRTDAGVHALHQVAHLRLRTAVDPRRFRLAVNDLLPHDVHVLALRLAADRFHARHDVNEASGGSNGRSIRNASKRLPRAFRGITTSRIFASVRRTKPRHAWSCRTPK